MKMSLGVSFRIKPKGKWTENQISEKKSKRIKTGRGDFLDGLFLGNSLGLTIFRNERMLIIQRDD